MHANLMKRYIKPVAKANGIYKNIGWHLPPYLRHTAQGQREKCKDRTGAFTACEQQDHTRRLYAGSGIKQAGCTKQGCKDDDSWRGSKRG